MILRIVQLLLAGLTLVAVISSTLLFNYARLSCHWQWPASSSSLASPSSFVRMVVMADPQMEGDAKIRRLGKRAIVDLAFNDAYMRHIYRSMMAPSWKDGSKPTHVTVLGDLFSSQWIDDVEFDIRLKRYQSIFVPPKQLYSFPHNDVFTLPILVNITGNHDIGYGYDINQQRILRWEKDFGASNYLFSVDIPPTSSSTLDRKVWFVVLNTMLLDGPSSDESLRNDTWTFLKSATNIRQDRPQDRIVLLTHIPLHKEAGTCVDPPDIVVSSYDQTIIEQTMLTPETSQWILNNLQPDFILNGHDHFGCDVLHSLVVEHKEKKETSGQEKMDKDENADEEGDDDDEERQGRGRDSEASTASPTWTTKRLDSTAARQSSLIDLSQPSAVAWPFSEKGDHADASHNDSNKEGTYLQKRSVREVTQRSMMAEFGGFSGLFEIRVSPSASSPTSNDGHDYLEMRYRPCGFYRDIYVWVVLVIDAIVIGGWLGAGIGCIILSAYRRLALTIAIKAPGLTGGQHHHVLSQQPILLDAKKDKID